MYRERKKGIACSVVLHLLLLLLVIFGLPSIFKHELPPEPTAITVELLPISKISNVKPSEGTVAEKPKPEEPKPEAEQKKPSPPVKTSSPTPPPPPPAPKPEVKKPVPKPIPKPEPKKPEPKPKKKPEESLDAILKDVRDAAKKEKTDKKEQPKDNTSSTTKSISNRFDPTQAMSISEKNAIMSQLAHCWNPPAGAKNAQELVVVVDAEFNSDGSYVRAELADESKSRYNSDTFFRAAADSALRAVRQCSPLKNLPPEKYETWRVMELHFDPREMLQ